MDDVESLARATFRHAGIEVSEDDLPLVALVYGGLLGQLAALEQADPATFPFEAVDPSRAPGRR